MWDKSPEEREPPVRATVTFAQWQHGPLHPASSPEIRVCTLLARGVDPHPELFGEHHLCARPREPGTGVFIQR